MASQPSQPDVSPAVIARLERYTPSCLAPGDWALAASAVRAAVLAAHPLDLEDTKGLASRLCLFLAGPCGWDRACAPEFERARRRSRTCPSATPHRRRAASARSASQAT
ncbi:MAG: hypothetical protein M0014_08010 [Actinomycetota bacterium]|nr:hypothetical protein [Actinomycetota bacterium]